jgi:hypothetical protein
MSDCAKYRHLLPHSDREGGDRALTLALRDHLAACRRCRVENGEMKEVISLGRSLFRAEEQLPAGVRHRIARAAAERSAPGGGWAGLLARPLLWTRRPGFATALAAALLVAVIAVPLALRDGEGRQGDLSTPTGLNNPTRIEMTTLADGAVHLAWSNGRRGSYTVTKSSDPRGVEGAERHLVRGNDWIDDDPGPSRIVFYRID